MVNALILAGEDHNSHFGTRVKGIVDINGKPMIQYIISVMKNCKMIDRIGVVGPYEVLYPLLGEMVDEVIDGRGSIIVNVMQGAKHLGLNRNILICTSDVPMLTVESLEDFLIRCEHTKADFCYPIIEKSLNEAMFPGIERTYTRMKEGTFTGGNLFYVNPKVLNKCCDQAQKLIAYRKNVFKMARVLGWEILVLLLTRRLTIMHAEKRFSQIFGIEAKAIISNYPELANDVDKMSHLLYARQYLKNKQIS